MDAFANMQFPLIVTNGSTAVQIIEVPEVDVDGNECASFFEVTAYTQHDPDEKIVYAKLSQREVALDIFVHTFQAMLSVGL